ncbi:SMC-Scp complex subunit ScpB [Candidatus Woesearchaeota archaeon]|nr:SMC-Scp complex subunit ScpB [Candidatus Woesearchaeota archaeon]
MLKNKIEALLFSSGRKMDWEEISKLTNAKPGEIQESLEELRQEYDGKASSLMLVNEGSAWKLTVREQFLPLVRKIVTETELSKTVLETLAVIAFKYPIKQSELIKIRTNKAYDHLKELEEMGYISRQKRGRTYLIKLTQKFFEYFDLQEEKLKEQFRDFASIAKVIEDKEREIEAIKQEQKSMAEEEKRKDEKIKKEIGSLEENKLPEESEERDDGADKEKKPESEGIKVTKEMEKIIDEKVNKILHPPKDDQGRLELENKKEEEKSESSEEEPKDLLEAEMGEKDEREK